MQLRIIDFNYPWQDATLLTSSSADSEFPVANLKKASRTKVWRSTGNFVIDATNNKINFKESGGGGQLTATITSGTYTPTTLAAEIKTRMQAAGAATYTITFSTATGKWTIATAGAFLSLLSNTGTNVGTSVWSAIGISTAADQTGALTYTGSNIAIHTEEWVVFDLVTAEAIDSCALLFDPLGSIPLSSNAVVKIQGNATNVWSSPSIDVTLTIDTVFDAATQFWSSDQTYRYWRLKIVDPANTNLFVEVGKLMLGKATQFSRIQKNGWRWSMMDQSKLERTPYGHQYADVYPILKTLEIDLTMLPYADIKTLQGITQRVGRTTPVLVAIDPIEDVYDKEQFLVFGVMSDLKLTHGITSYFDAPLVIEETA